MSKKNWIMIKRGLSQDTKHRERIGQAIWCFMHIIDRADWETGTVLDWKDQDEAADMGINVRTLREWRRSLDENNYISCKQEQYGQRIVIHNWINPRNYSGDVLNPFPQGDIKTVPQSGVQDTPQGYTQGSRKDVTPTYSSGNQESPSKKGDVIDGMLEYAKQSNGKSYPLRDKIPAPYLEYADWYVHTTGQKPRKPVLGDWLLSFDDWTSAGLCVKDLQNAYEYANRPSGGFLVGRPGSLTNTAIALKSKPSYAPAIDQSSVDATRRMLEEKEQIKAAPPPASIRQLMKGMQSCPPKSRNSKKN